MRDEVIDDLPTQKGGAIYPKDEAYEEKKGENSVYISSSSNLSIIPVLKPAFGHCRVL